MIIFTAKYFKTHNFYIVDPVYNITDGYFIIRSQIAIKPCVIPK